MPRSGEGSAGALSGDRQDPLQKAPATASTTQKTLSSIISR
jgi:hypothetical protein